MIHLVFQEADIDVLKKAIELDESLAGDIVQIKDDYAVGPVNGTAQERKAWWTGLLQYSPYTSSVETVDDEKTLTELLQRLSENEDEQLWLWMGQNQHDVCGYYSIIAQLQPFQGRVHILYLNNLPFINEKGGIFYPSVLHEILPKEFLKAKKLARPVTPSEFEVDSDEWKKLCELNAGVRLLEGGKKIKGADISYYDDEILKAAGAPQKLNRFLAGLLSKMKVKTGDVFLVWRIRELAAQGLLSVGGDWEKGWKDIDVAKAGAVAPVNAEEGE